jgi:thiol reductant ABC exporter CydC subunit
VTGRAGGAAAPHDPAGGLSSIAALRSVLALVPAPRGRLAVAVALGALTVAFGVGLMATAGYLISRAAQRPAVLSLTVAIVGVRFFGIGRPIVRYVEKLTSHDLALRVLARVRTRVIARIEPLAPAGLAGYRRGDLLARMVADVDALQNLHPRAVIPPLVALVAGALSVGVAAAFLPAAAVVLAAGLVVAGAVVPALSAIPAWRGGRREAAARGALSAELVELLGAAPELVAYGGQGVVLDRVRAADGALVKLARRDALAAGAADGLTLAVTGATVAGVVAVSVSAAAAGRIDTVLIAMLGLLALASFEGVAPLAGAARQLAPTLAAGRRVLELTATEPAVSDPQLPAPAPEAPFTIELDNVSARYRPGDPMVLGGFDLTLEPGRRVALTGPSGAGKTTVANLLLRFLDPEQGGVTVDGVDFRDLRQEDIRRAIAVAGQDPHLFSTSIRENVRLARPAATDDEVAGALRRARIWRWVESLPHGWDTLVGEEGRELSGGQRQRIALARAMVSDAPVLVLDEPTAHLDRPTAEALMEDILSATGERTVLLITHRPEGLHLVDEVVALTPYE